MSNISYEILIQEQIAVVLPIGQIINYHELATMWPQRRLPTRIKTVMIYDQPIWFVAVQNHDGRLSIVFPIAIYPVRMCWLRSIVWFSCFRIGVLQWQRE